MRIETPRVRVQTVNDAPVRAEGDFVVYWMTASRRPSWNFALDRAAALANELARPLMVVESLPCDGRWDCDRTHHFVLDGMADNAAAFSRQGILYHPHLEKRPGAGRQLLAALAGHACAVITDEFPGSGPGSPAPAGAPTLPVRLEQVDGNGIVPLRAPDRTFPTAHGFRRWIQKNLAGHLSRGPLPRRRSMAVSPPALPRGILERWPAVPGAALTSRSRSLAGLPIDHDVERPDGVVGGHRAGRRILRRFVTERLPRYHHDRNHPRQRATSELSPYLHFGHVAPHEVLAAVTDAESWTLDRLSTRTDGSRTGWWGMSPPAEAFLDQLVTWRELGYNTAFHVRDFERLDSLPSWALATLEEHWNDPRPRLYTSAQLETGGTHDALWNAAQTQLVREGTIHNYLRMLWGKKILEWSETPAQALETMIHLNNKYALDGRNPNSISGIFWVLGRYDRPWGPERPVFGKIRYMSSENTARKTDLTAYLERHGQQRLFEA